MSDSFSLGREIAVGVLRKLSSPLMLIVLLTYIHHKTSVHVTL